MGSPIEKSGPRQARFAASSIAWIVFSKSRSRQLQQQLIFDSHGAFKSTASCEYIPQGRNVSLTAFLDRESRIACGRRCGGLPTTSTIPDSLCRSPLKR